MPIVPIVLHVGRIDGGRGNRSKVRKTAAWLWLIGLVRSGCGNLIKCEIVLIGACRHNAQRTTTHAHAHKNPDESNEPNNERRKEEKEGGVGMCVTTASTHTKPART